MADHYPLLAIKYALDDALQALDEIKSTLEALRKDSEGRYPPGGTLCLQQLGPLYNKLANIMSPELAQAIAQEQAEYDRQHGEVDETRLPPR